MSTLAGWRIGWIGVGRMGTPIGQRLIDAGATLTVYDLDRARARALNVAVAASPAALAAEADVIFSMIPDDAALRAVADELAPALSAAHTYVDMSTVSPAASAAVAEQLAPTGAAYLRCPVSGSTATAAAGALTLLASGPADAFERLTPVLAAFSAKRTLYGPAEEGRVVKLMVNLIVAATPVLLGEAMHFGTRLGLSWDQVVDAIGASVAASPLYAYKAEMLKKRDWTAAAPVDLTAKDVDLAMAVAREAHVPLPLSALMRQVQAQFQAAGDGDLDFFSLVTWLERQS
jgi:3-hydroxyisobutyrate dehydrogenase